MNTYDAQADKHAIKADWDQEHHGNVLLSGETRDKPIELDWIIYENLPQFMRLLRLVDDTSRDCLIQHYVLGLPQYRISPTVGLMQSRIASLMLNAWDGKRRQPPHSDRTACKVAYKADPEYLGSFEINLEDGDMDVLFPTPSQVRSVGGDSSFLDAD
jgi:hypothetical protein